MPTRTALLPFVYLTIATAAWGSTWVVLRGLHAEFPPIAFAFWRWACAGIVMLPLALPHLKRDWPVMRAHWRSLFVLGALGTMSFAVAAAVGVNYTTATNAALINAATPVFCLMLSTVFLRSPVTGRFLLAVLLSIAGILLITTRGRLEVLRTLEFNVGDLIVLAGTFVWATYTVGLRWRPAGPHALSFLFATVVVGLLVWLPVYAWEIARGELPALTLANVAAALYLGVLPSFIAYICWNDAVPKVGPLIGALFGNLVPVFAAAFALVFLGEQPQRYHFLGMFLVIGGLIISSRTAGVPSPAPLRPR
jgi:drug/metabolite transporter (DMT)-like permease